MRQIEKNGKVIGLFTELEPITKKDVSEYPDLRFIATPCTGTDHVYIPEGVKLIHLDDEWKRTEGREVTSTAEHTWSLILQLAKRKRMQLSGKTIGIIGYGRIGQQVDEYAESFYMESLIYDKYFGIYSKIFGTVKTIYTDIERVLKYSDIITLHVPLNDSTRGMIGKEQFDIMKDGALLVNTSRAEIVDEDALIKAICSMKLGGYADDFEEDHGDLSYHCDGFDNVIITNHIGGNCHEARQATDEYIWRKINEYMEVVE